MPKPLDGYVQQCHTFGRSGFNSLAAAQADASQSCSADNITFLKYEAGTVSRCEEFAWVWPPEYAEQLVKNNDRIKIIS